MLNEQKNPVFPDNSRESYSERTLYLFEFPGNQAKRKNTDDPQ